MVRKPEMERESERDVEMIKLGVGDGGRMRLRQKV